jgi:hypothetical protein
MTEQDESTKTLWMLEYHDGFGYNLAPFYALSEADVERQVQQWIELTPYEVKRIGLRAYPRGFTIHRSTLPGKIPATPNRTSGPSSSPTKESNKQKAAS